MILSRICCGFATILAISAMPGGSAELDYGMPSIFYDGMNAKLIGRGYREVRVMDPESGLISAVDPQGSEVLLRVDTDRGRIVTSSYVHPADG